MSPQDEVVVYLLVFVPRLKQISKCAALLAHKNCTRGVWLRNAAHRVEELEGERRGD
jgi:hypothetical protein